MTELKKLSYKLEDTFILGKSLPVVAMRQLVKLARQFSELPDEPGYEIGTQKAISRHIVIFLDRNEKYIDDERELLKIFNDAVKRHLYGPCLLTFFQTEQ